MFAALQTLSVDTCICIRSIRAGGGGGGGGKEDVQTCICVLIRTASKCYLTHTKVQACSFTARAMFKSVIIITIIIQCIHVCTYTHKDRIFGLSGRRTVYKTDFLDKRLHIE